VTDLPIGKVLCHLREHAGISQRHLETRMTLPRQYISRIENGRVMPCLVTLIKFADALQVPVWEIVHKIKLVADGELILTPPVKLAKAALKPPARRGRQRTKLEPPKPVCMGCGGEREPGRNRYCGNCREQADDMRYSKPLMEIEAPAEIPEHVREMRREFDRLVARGSYRAAERIQQQMYGGA
jgi:transcriptional regulator with XRE-family HTH domain